MLFVCWNLDACFDPWCTRFDNIFITLMLVSIASFYTRNRYAFWLCKLFLHLSTCYGLQTVASCGLYIYISSSTVDTSLLSVVTSLLKQLISPHETISRPYYVCFCFTLTLCNHILKRTFTRRRIIMNKKIFSLRYCNCIQSISLTLTTCSNYILKLTKFDLCANEMLQLNHAGLNVIN